MKTIQVSEKMYDFLINLSDELKKQGHRSTAMPYFFQIRTKKRIPAFDNCGDIVTYYNGEIELEGDDEIIDYYNQLIEYGEDLEKTNDISEIISYLEDNGFNEYFWSIEYEYKNAFLTEKACKNHIECNYYHYNEPVDFLNHAFRNPELEKVMEFILSLTNNK